jgi:hypothetical protein
VGKGGIRSLSKNKIHQPNFFYHEDLKVKWKPPFEWLW